MTKEQEKISRHNNYRTRKKLNILHTGLQLHHIDESMKHNNIERYIEWRPEDLEILTCAEHARITFKGKPMSKEHREHISQALKGTHDYHGAKNPNYGKKHPGVGGRPKGSEPTKGSTGMHWFNDGIESVLRYECPEGFVKGRICKYRGKQPDC